MSTKNLHKLDKILSDAIMSRIHKAFSVEEKWGSLGLLAEKFKTSASVVSGWKKRGVPKEAILTTSLETGYKKHWIETGEGPMRDDPPERPQQIREGQGDYYSATTHKIAQMVEAMDEQTRKDICLSVEKEKLLRELLRQRESDEKAG